MRDPILSDLLSRKGAVTKVAKANGITAGAVCQWRRVPANRIAATAAALGVKPEVFQDSTPAGEAA